MFVSARIKNVPASPIRKLAGDVQKAKDLGKKIYPLNIGQPDIATPPVFFEAVKGYDVKTLAYGISQGNPELIEAVRRYYEEWGIHYTKSNIYITNGGSEALAFAVMCLCDVDDEVVMLEPFYANYKNFINQYNVKVVPVPTSPENGYRLPDMATIEKAITPRTKAILVSNPGNPTGMVFTEEEMEVLSQVVLKHNIVLIADEVYREFVYDGKFNSFASRPELEQNLIVIDSVSKRFSACGARIGCIISKNALLDEQFEKCCQGRLCCPALEQVGAAALYTTPPSYFQEVNEEYKRRRDTLRRELAKIPGIISSEPQGAFYVMVKLPVDDTETFARWMLTDFADQGDTVLITPGYGFYEGEGKGLSEARLAYVINCEDLTRAIELLGKGLAQYNARK